MTVEINKFYNVKTFKRNYSRMYFNHWWPLCCVDIIRYSKGPRFDSEPGLILGSWIMVRHVKCILLLEWSTTS